MRTSLKAKLLHKSKIAFNPEYAWDLIKMKKIVRLHRSSTEQGK